MALGKHTEGPRVFPITDRLRLLFDDTCWTLQILRKKTRVSDRTEYLSWIDKGYYGKLEDCVHHLLESDLGGSEVTDVHSLVDAINRTSRAIILALNALEQSCAPTLTKHRS